MKQVECRCETCGNVFYLYRSQMSRGRGKYCSKQCHAESMKKSITVQCLQCGISFQLMPSHIHASGNTYCSKECYGKSKKLTVDRLCDFCGKGFTPRKAATDKGMGKYCSVDCFFNSRKSRVITYCLQCGNLIESRPLDLVNGLNKYCSRRCLAKSKIGTRNPMWRGGSKSQYRGTNWGEQRKLAYERDKGICQYCGRTPKVGQRRFDVHHIKPYREFKGDYKTANCLLNLITLCSVCHKLAEHSKIILQPKLI